MTDSLPYNISQLTVNADYHQGNQVWSTHTNAYESWTDAHYNSGYYSVTAPQDGGGSANSAIYTSTTPTGVVAAGTYTAVFRQHVDGTAANDVVIGRASSDSAGALTAESNIAGIANGSIEVTTANPYVVVPVTQQTVDVIQQP